MRRFVSLFLAGALLSQAGARAFTYTPADDLPNPPAHLENLPAGSLIIPMDNSLQNLVAPFNLKAYGLANKLLQTGIPLKWAISSTKAKDGIDFSGTAKRIFPTTTAATALSFKAGPIVVHRDFASMARVAIAQFNTANPGNNVAVYELTAAATADIRYDLKFKPRIGISTTNAGIHTDLLTFALIPNYVVVADTTILGSSCYTIFTQPHTTSTAGIAGVLAYVQAGGNLLCECKAVDTYENLTTTHFQTTQGYSIANVNTVLTYPNAPLAFSQFEGVVDPNPGGSETEWNLASGSVFQNNGHVHLQNSGTNTDKFAATASKLSNGQGGLVFYLGGHDYGAGGSDITSINGQRMILNTVFHPTAKFAACNQDFSAAIKTISGLVSEDVNGDGVMTDGAARPNVNVRLYQDVNNNGLVDAADVFLTDGVTDAAGAYSFTISTDLSGNNYLVAVDSKSVTPSAGLRGGFTAGDVWAEQTFGDDSATATLDLGPRFGGRNGAVSDNFNAADTTPANNAYQHLARVNVTTVDIVGVDFGFSFNAVTSMRAGDGADDDTTANRTVQGSFRQFLQNANAIAGANAMRFTPAVAANAGTWWRIGVSVALPAINDANTTIDGQAYSNTDGITPVDSNAGTVGAGGTVGVGALPLASVNKPELEIQNLRSTALVNVGLDVQAASAAIRRLAIYGFGAAANSDASANIRIGASGGSALIEQNILGSAAGAFVDPGAATRSAGDNLRLIGSASTTAQNNAIGFSTGNGIAVSSNAAGAQILGNEIRGDGLGSALLSGILISSGSATVQGNLLAANQGAGVEIANGAGANTLVNNTVTGNGAGAGGVTAGLRLLGAASTVDRNLIHANSGSGILVPASGAQNTLTKNSLFQNGALGIDLLGAAENQNAGTAPFVTINDNGDGDSGGNGLLNFPVITDATAASGNLVLNGYARPGAAIELFLAEADPSNFGEGKTYLLTLVEGSGQDSDPGTGTYTNPVNGLNQGTDTTNKFTFTIPLPSGVTIGSVLTSTATLGNATSEFSGNVVVAGPITGVDVTGLVYEDGNLNLLRDATENGTGLTLFVKLINPATPAAPALAVATVDPVTGAYTLSNVVAGTYSLILDDNNTLADVTSTLPASWTVTESSGGIRTPVAVASVPLPNQNFGLYHGVLITGRVFNDNGAGGGIANDGIRNGGEAGLADVALQLTDASGATLYASSTTNGGGDYALAVPSTIAAGTALKIRETNSNGFLSTGATVGNTSGTYDRATDTIAFNLAANSSYSAVDFGDVPSNALATEGQQSGLPGTVIFYPHTFTAGSAGSVTFSSSQSQTPPFPGWTATIFRDANANGQFDAGEPAISGPIPVVAGETVFVLVKIFIPVNAAFGARDTATLSASFAYSGAAPALTHLLSRQDLTTVGNPTTAGLRLNKTVDKPSALPGENITYTISYTNTSSDQLRNVIIYDTTPAFTTFVSAATGPLPLDLTGVVVSAPAPGATGAMRWTFTGTLSPGGTGTVSFVVKLDQ